MSTLDLWLDAIGRLHPVLLHFPLALAVAGAMVETAAWLARRPGPTASGFVMVLLAAASAPLASLSGWLNAAFGDEDSQLLQWHRLSGIASAVALAVVAILAIRARRHADPGGHPPSPGEPSPAPAAGSAASAAVGAAALADARGSSMAEGASSSPQIECGRRASGPVRLFRAALLTSALLIAWCGHLGGELKWGENYTTSRLFQAIRATIGARSQSDLESGDHFPGEIPGVRSALEIDDLELRYEEHILPLFASRCADCHLGGRSKGRLSLASREDVVKVNRDGLSLVTAGRPDESELLRRIQLPPGDPDAMPPDGPPMPEEEVHLVRRWIEAGAN